MRSGDLNSFLPCLLKSSELDSHFTRYTGLSLFEFPKVHTSYMDVNSYHKTL